MWLIEAIQQTNISQLQKKYWEFMWNNFAWTLISSIDEFKDIVQKLLNESEKNLITISSQSWRWKTNFVNDLTEKQIILPPKEQIIVKHIIWERIDEKWYTHWDYSVFHAEADWFLWLIGNERYTTMIETYENFLKYFWDKELAVQTIIKFLTQNETFIQEWIYWKTNKEREEQRRWTKLEFTSSQQDNKKLIILDWTNALEIWNLIKETSNSTWINVSKILLDPCPETSFMWILNRDVLKYWRNLDFVTYFRPKEFALIIKAFIKPALEDSEVLLFDNYKRPNFDFKPKFLLEVIDSLKKSKILLLNENLDTYMKAFIEIFIDNLIERFIEMSEKK